LCLSFSVRIIDFFIRVLAVGGLDRIFCGNDEIEMVNWWDHCGSSSC